MVSAGAAAFVSVIGVDELGLLVGLGLLGYGCWLAWPPAGFIVPGGIVLWVYVPSRTAFIERATTTDRKSLRRAS